jgi:hypothetical protein
MIQTKNISTDLEAHVTNALGSFSDKTRTRQNVANDFNNIYGIRSTLTGTFSFSTLQSYMAANKPIYAGINWSSGGGHGVAISGTDNSAGTYLRIMDPFYGWQYPSYSSFLSNYMGSGSWSHSIYFN